MPLGVNRHPTTSWRPRVAGAWQGSTEQICHLYFTRHSIVAKQPFWRTTATALMAWFCLWRLAFQGRPGFGTILAIG